MYVFLFYIFLILISNYFRFLDPNPKSHKPSSSLCFPIISFPFTCPVITLHCRPEPFQDQGLLLPYSWSSFDIWIILLKIFTGLYARNMLFYTCNLYLLSSHCVLNFLYVVVKSWLHFAFSLTLMSMFSLLSSAPEILSSISSIIDEAFIHNSWFLS